MEYLLWQVIIPHNQLIYGFKDSLAAFTSAFADTSLTSQYVMNGNS